MLFKNLRQESAIDFDPMEFSQLKLILLFCLNFSYTGKYQGTKKGSTKVTLQQTQDERKVKGDKLPLSV